MSIPIVYRASRPFARASAIRGRRAARGPARRLIHGGRRSRPILFSWRFAGRAADQRQGLIGVPGGGARELAKRAAGGVDEIGRR